MDERSDVFHAQAIVCVWWLSKVDNVDEEKDNTSVRV